MTGMKPLPTLIHLCRLCGRGEQHRRPADSGSPGSLGVTGAER